ncbi:hypothetical protein CALCODRAFT_155192 [Calocera cornea HHB12733]|uniref:Uncharacterized protein n=1 Tax=Calocera cornea HHB12733 TaxID=1353952 RepID=A0A165CLB3_9BASI|nr:hypothetical protein CALCODRAFT_155192 [Calocera cornea HHB12733]
MERVGAQVWDASLRAQVGVGRLSMLGRGRKTRPAQRQTAIHGLRLSGARFARPLNVKARGEWCLSSRCVRSALPSFGSGCVIPPSRMCAASPFPQPPTCSRKQGIQMAPPRGYGTRNRNNPHRAIREQRPSPATSADLRAPARERSQRISRTQVQVHSSVS